ncbi:YvdQ family spore coat protein [Orrella dioscoreae]|uniref:hypothetical protein n=1 Tax=Orrella dioscoreae TaxID=1851544 RepID=UPI0012FFFB82|nr:hypothetical protein [Orrella dioscoreae]
MSSLTAAVTSVSRDKACVSEVILFCGMSAWITGGQTLFEAYPIPQAAGFSDVSADAPQLFQDVVHTVSAHALHRHAVSLRVCKTKVMNPAEK